MSIAALCTLLVTLLAADTPLEEMFASPDVERRLEAVERLRLGEAEAPEETLLALLGDPDWEVVEAAVVALGERGGEESVVPLLEMCLEGPVRRIRLAAARSLKAIDAEAAAGALERRLRGSDLVAAAEALAVLARPETAEALEKLAKRRSRDGIERLLGVRGLGALGDPEHLELFTDLLDDPDVRVRAAAVDAIVATGVPEAARPLRDELKDPDMPAVMQRRHIAGLHALLSRVEDGEKREFAGRMCARSFGGAADARVDARFARLLGSLGRADHPVGDVDEYVSTLTTHGLRHRDAQVRAASAAALARIGLAESFDPVRDVAQQDAEPRVRFHALRAAVALKGDDASGLMIDRLRYDEHPMVREEAAAMLGRHRVETGLQTLINTLDDESWEVCVSVAVSLGKLRRPEGVEPLKELLGHRDWRRRGAAVAGLGWIRQTAAIEPMIEALRDREPAVVATAREFLRYVSGQTHEAKTRPWREWWDEYRTRFEFLDREKMLRDAKKYGYAVQPRQVYEDLDVVVLKTRGGGDNIQDLLDQYGIAHRIIRAASVDDAGVHPFALFVANCPGEIVDDDVERLQWFVRAGGYLFASCWALTHTVEACFPEVVTKLETRAQVLDTVRAVPCPVESPLLEDVFTGSTRPLYELVGAHLIDVVDPERFEVLIDSPGCATDWGDGNLAGWFSIGHGVVLDSANHFDMQGMKQAKTRTEEDRMAFAIDHLGYDYDELRALREEGVFRKQTDAIRRTRDQTIFRFITTFVRQKRLADNR